MQGSIPFFVLHNRVELFLQQSFDTLFMTIACCIVQTGPPCKKDVTHAFKSGQLRDHVRKKPGSPSPSTALESDGCFSIAASSLSIMPSFAAAIAAGVTSIAVTTLGLAELTVGRTV